MWKFVKSEEHYWLITDGFFYVGEPKISPKEINLYANGTKVKTLSRHWNKEVFCNL